ncbi:nucleotidyltransferase domain-containing protein [Candidatus Poribacteria bacterium]|nr:nucleotidyltransferase domain-containing protein [Candidatus Poribacteria bacterium]
MVDAKIINIVQKFISVLIGNGINVEKVVLYGSYASGNIRTDSDLDIAVISSDFGKDRFEEGKMLLKIAWRIDPRIEPIPISTKSYENDTWIPLIHEIKQKGIELKIA